MSFVTGCGDFSRRTTDTISLSEDCTSKVIQSLPHDVTNLDCILLRYALSLLSLGGEVVLKKERRTEMRAHLASIDDVLYQSYSQDIENRFLMEESVLEASVVGITISSFPEVNTKGVIHRLWDMGKTVVVPKCSPKGRSMTFYIIENFEQLEKVYMQLLEPNPLKTKSVNVKDIDLLVVPGIIYSRLGYRIGYGGGYYDRFLTNYLGRTTSLAFDCQLSNDVPIENFDIPVDQIITNSQLIDCKSNRKEE